ncbi:MAG: hypothetical protein ACJAQ3_002107 [Planctomycetota bacterium]|jgi:hypothetical protein
MFLLATLLLAAPDVLDVDPTAGPYLEIHDAAAASGDVIRFTPGTYDHFAVFGKSLVIVPRSPGDIATIAGAVRVQNLGQHQRVVLANLSVQPASSDSSLTLADNDGAVRVEGCRFQSTSWFGARVLDSLDVTFEGCVLIGGCGGGAFGCEGFAGLLAENSNLTLWDTVARGAAPTSYGYVGGAGIEATECGLCSRMPPGGRRG